MTRRWEPWPGALPAGLATGLSVSAGTIAIVCLNLADCGPPSSPAASAPAKPAGPPKVTTPTKEADLATVILTPGDVRRPATTLVSGTKVGKLYAVLNITFTNTPVS